MTLRKLVAAAALAALPWVAGAQQLPVPLPDQLSFAELAARCAPEIDLLTLAAVVRTESSFNPFAIGVVGSPLARQPRNLEQALATAKSLQQRGVNFSLGWAQVNRFNLLKLGETYAGMFDRCRNLKAGAAILQGCYRRARAAIAGEQQALRAAFSCYYSGNFRRGFLQDANGQPSYVQKVVANALGAAPPPLTVPAVKPLSASEVSPASAARATAIRPVAAASHPAAAPWVVLVDTNPTPTETSAAASSAPVAPTQRQAAAAQQTSSITNRIAAVKKKRSRAAPPFVQIIE